MDAIRARLTRNTWESHQPLRPESRVFCLFCQLQCLNQADQRMPATQTIRKTIVSVVCDEVQDQTQA